MHRSSREGLGLAAAALVDEHNAVRCGVEEARHARTRAAARPAVDEEHRLAILVAVHCVVDGVKLRDF